MSKAFRENLKRILREEDIAKSKIADTKKRCEADIKANQKKIEDDAKAVREKFDQEAKKKIIEFDAEVKKLEASLKSDQEREANAASAKVKSNKDKIIDMLLDAVLDVNFDA